MTRMNALHNCKNPYQGKEKRILCVCSAGLLRSPTIAFILAQHGYNTRSAGVHDYALVEVDDVLVAWADAIVCAEDSHMDILKAKYKHENIIALNIPDTFRYKDPVLMQLIKEALVKHEYIINDEE